MIAARRVRAWLAAACLAATMPCAANDDASVAADVLRTPSRAFEQVSDRQQLAYVKLLGAYAREETAHPADVALVIARCDFVAMFADSEEVTWAEDAQNDYQACQKQLADRFQGDAEANLYVAEHRYGKESLEFANGLLPASDHWTLKQRARLHAVLARGHTAAKQTKLAGEEALAAVRLDPGSDQLVTALRYLCDTGHQADAEAMLASAPPPAEHSWLETQRVHLAADKLSPAAALAELRRAEQAKAPIDAWLKARVYLLAGMPAEAADALSHIKVQPAYQNPEQFKLRMEIAAARKDGKAAETALHEWFGKTGITMPLLVAYGKWLTGDPRQLFSISLAPLALALLATLLFLACMPGLLAFPAHYRGTVRARLNKPTLSLFEPIGLRHMWWGLGAFLVASAAVPMLWAGDSLPALEGARSMLAGEQATVFTLYLATVLAGAALLACVAWRLPWRAWAGDQGLKAAVVTVLVWSVLKILVVWALAHAPHTAAPAQVNSHDRVVATLILAAHHVGGPALALALIAVLVPLYEELVFRGFILGGLARHISFGWANAWQALLFAALHFDAQHFVFYLAIGLLAGWLVRRTRGLGASIALHAANNAVACVAILLSMG